MPERLGEAITPHHHPWCYGCGPDNPHGLHLPWDAVTGTEGAAVYAATLALDERHQGGPGLAHGGIVSAALDEAMGILVQHVAFPAVTARLEVRFRRPVPTGRPLSLSAHVARRAGKQVHAHAELHHGEELLAEADGVFLQVSLRHFLRTPEGQEQRRLWEERLGRRAAG